LAGVLVFQLKYVTGVTGDRGKTGDREKGYILLYSYSYIRLFKLLLKVHLYVNRGINR
jgi:hypothetical protein